MAKSKVSKEKWREYAQRRRERIKNDPVLAAIEKEKEKKKYEAKKMKKQVKLVKDMSKRELRQKRKLWRKKAKEAYQRKKQRGNLAQYLEERSPPVSEPENDRPVVDQRINSGRKKVKKDRAKAYREINKLRQQNEALKKQAAKWRQKHWRLLQNMTDESSPRRVVSKLLKRGNQKEIRRKLLFGEALGRQLKENFKQVSAKGKKRAFGKILAGYGKFLLRYKLMSNLRGTISSKVFNSSRMLTNNKQLRERAMKINAMVVKDVQTFFEDEESSKLCPGKKDCLTKNKVKKQKRILCDTMKNLQKKFLDQVDYKISYVSFCKLKPFWVVSQKASERDTCLCKQHANIELLTSALFKAGIIDNGNPKEFARRICCDVGNVNCLQRKCDTCKNLVIPYSIFENGTAITYLKWQKKQDTYTDKNQKNRIVRHIVKEKVTQSAMEAVDCFDVDFKKFLFHEGNFIHQFRAIKALKLRMNEDEVLIHCDFSENYSMKYSSEIQAFHFGGSRQQVTLHTSQIYFRKDAYSKLSSQSMCTVSECLDHGPAAVWVHLKPILNFITQTVTRIRVIHFLTDSPATQYRNKSIFYLIAHAIQQNIDVSIATWNYMEAGHGKGAPDGVGGCLKRTADRIVAQGKDIDSFITFVQALKNNVRNVEISVVDAQEIESMKKILPQTIPSFHGTMKVHQVVFIKDQPHQLAMRKLSCFDCFNCQHHFLGNHLVPPLTDDELEDFIPENVGCDVLPDLATELHERDLSSPPLQMEIWNPPSIREEPSTPAIPSTSAGLAGEPSISTEPSTTAKPHDTLTTGTFILASFKNESKTNDTPYRYVCSVNAINDDGTMEVIGLRRFQKSMTQFEVKDNDVCVINTDDVFQVLPLPNFILRNRKMVYSFPCQVADVREQ